MAEIRVLVAEDTTLVRRLLIQQLAREKDLVVVGEAVNGREAVELALHPRALAAALGPWSEPVPVVFHGGTLSSPLYGTMVKEALGGDRFLVREPSGEAVDGALRLAMS